MARVHYDDDDDEENNNRRGKKDYYSSTTTATAAAMAAEDENALFLRRSASATMESSSSGSSSCSGMVYDGGQSLASILNNPALGKAGVYTSESTWWGVPGASSEPPPMVASRTFPEICRADFRRYSDSVAEHYARFEDVRSHAAREGNVKGNVKAVSSSSSSSSSNAAMAACLREVPALYLREDFALEEPHTFEAACGAHANSDALTEAVQEKLSHYLDVVEAQLVREISLRSESFFAAQAQLDDLSRQLIVAFAQLRELQSTVKLLDADMVQNALQIQTLSRTRANFVSLHKKLKMISYVNQSLVALKLLVEAADCAGALDVIDGLQQLQESNSLVGLHCFRHLGNQLVSSLNAVNSILAADFVRAAIHDAKNYESAFIATIRTKEMDVVSRTLGDDLLEVKLADDISSGLGDRLLPFVIGLLRTAKLPAVLRVYCDTLVADIKASIKTTVSGLLPILLMRIPDTEMTMGDRQVEMDGAGLSMASKLRNLPAENFVQLLTAIFRVVQIHLIHAAEVKKVIEWIMGGLDGCYAADAVAAAFASGAAVAAAAEAAQETDSPVSSNISVSSRHGSPYGSLPMLKMDEGTSPSTVSKNFRADVLRESTEAVFAACEAAHARWAKLLGVRALVHPKLRLQDFLSVHNISQKFLCATEKVGGRLGYSIRGSLQSQCKAFIDYQHNTRVTKLSAVLDQETWVAIDVSNEFQAIVYSITFSESNVGDDHEAVPDSSNETVNGLSTALGLTVKLDGNSSAMNNDSSGIPMSGVLHKDEVPLPGAINTRDGTKIGVATKMTGDHMQADPKGRVKKGRDRLTVKTLNYQGVGYHMVNSGISLLEMISEYVDISRALPNFASDILHRVADILKLFNTRTCHLVLGAGAMQVSGLKSITAKHLALASQTISFYYALIPDVKRMLLLHIPEAHRTVLLSEIDKIQQDYKVHTDEIHLKLVQIMKERLLLHIQTFPQIVDSWNKIDDNDVQPSQFARALLKEVGVLQRVISPILLETDVQIIFRQVVQNFHIQISEAFSKIDISNPRVKNRLYKDACHILQNIRTLPTDCYNEDGLPNPGELDKFVLEKFGKETIH